MKFDSSSAWPFWPLSLLLQLPYQSDPGVSAGKRSAGRGGRQREAEPDQAGGVHQLPGGLSDHAEERIRHPWSQGSLRLLAEPKQNMLADWLPLLWIALNLHLNHLLFALSNIHCNAPRQSIAHLASNSHAALQKTEKIMEELTITRGALEHNMRLQSSSAFML